MLMNKGSYIHELADVKTDTIGEGTVIWQYAVVVKGARIGKNCNVNCHTFIEQDVVIGDNVTLKSGVYLWNGLRVEDDVFIGPNATFVNDKHPRSKVHEGDPLRTVIKRGASLGAGSVVLGGIVIGAYALVGAGSLVTRDVPDFALVKGSPAVICGWVDREGNKLEGQGDGPWMDKAGIQYVVVNNKLTQV